MPEGAENWASADYRRLMQEWSEARRKLADRQIERSILDVWLACRQREFAIETGAIEGLYTLRRGVTEQLIAEGLEGVRGAHTAEKLEDRTIRGLLADQEAALETVFAVIQRDRPLSHSVLFEWHALLVRHQETVTALTPDGRRVEVPFREKGKYKVVPNNPRRQDGHAHEYCPPEHCRSEMDRLFRHYRTIREREYAPEIEAAWLHHRFVRTHPFRDGNGRVSRLLMAYCYVRRGLPPPVVTMMERSNYIDALEHADEGDLRPFVTFLALRASASLLGAVGAAKKALAGRNRMQHPNGGVTRDGRYYPPAAGATRPADLVDRETGAAKSVR